MRIENIIPDRKIPYRARPQSTTLRDFSGGWNIYDDDMNMSHKYATKLVNLYPTAEGTLRLRYGTRLMVNCANGFSTVQRVVNIEYFNNAIIVVGSAGEILAVAADGTITKLWDTAIAASRPNSPAPWGPTTFVSFAQFNGSLILCNGSDKPLIIDQLFTVDYLQDLATGTNIHVPICSYVVSINRYLVMAGDPLEPDRIHISARDASGTWYGDPPPNDATRIDVGSVLPGATTIRGLLPFRGKLIVMFAEGMIFGDIGATDESGNHTPEFEDGVAGFGSISHRAAIAYGDDGLFMDLEGVPSISRTLLSGSFKPERASELIDSEIKTALASLSFGTMEERVFSIYDKNLGQFMLFVPNSNDPDTTTETRCFVYNYRPSQRQQAWCEFRGWNFSCATRSLGGLIFFGDSSGRIWVYGTDDDPIYQDKIGAAEATEVSDIAFEWEMPWLDFGNRALAKHTKYLAFDTRGGAAFRVRMYVDNLTKTMVGVDNPTLDLNFFGGEQGGIPGAPQPFNLGRNTSVRTKSSWPAKFQIAKMRISGSARERMDFVSMTFHYQAAGINR